jgi:O-antigen/teichoic acid export membrane protein
MAEVAREASPQSSEDVAATAGRGFLVITGAKLWFMLGGALISFGLPYVFHSKLYPPGTDAAALYGQYTDLNNTLSILSMVMITGVLQSVSRFVSQTPDRAGGVVKQALALMGVIGALVGGGFAIAAPWLAEARQNPELTLAYRLAGVVLFCYSLYSVFIGVLNGRKHFFRQALFDITFTTMKALLMVGLAAAGLGVQGAFGGFATAAALIMILAAVKVGRSTAAGEPARGFAFYAFQVMLYTFVFNLIFKLDVWQLKPAAAAVLAHGGGDVGTAIDRLVGQYGTAVNFARLPWQGTLAITFVLFPLMSEATFAQDKERTRLYVRQTLRYAMLLVGAGAVVLAAVPRAPVGLQPPELGPAVIALVWLAPAYFCFSLFNIVNTILTSAGRATAALVIGIITVGAAAALYQFVLPMAPDAEALLRWTGVTTLAAFVLGLALGLGVLWRLYGPPVPGATTLRVLGLGTALIVGGHYLPEMGKIGSLMEAAAVGVAFIVGLVATGEISAEDRARFQRVIRRKKAAA